MLKIIVPEHEIGFNDETGEFIFCKKYEFQFEHSLISISKWEAKWNKAFFGRMKKTDIELVDYIRCMLIAKNESDYEGLEYLTRENLDEINRYISQPMTATKIKEDPNAKKSSDVMTSELIYYLMIAYEIPFECQKWHINRLLTLIRVCQAKAAAAEKKAKSPKANPRSRSALNRARKHH